MGLVLEGDDRIEFLAPLGRRVRMGSPAQLALSDRLRVLGLLQSGDLPRAAEYVDYLHGLYRFMLCGCKEWLSQWPATLQRQLGQPASQAISLAVRRAGQLAPSATGVDQPASGQACEALLKNSEALYAETLSSLERGAADSSQRFQAYFAAVRSSHDAMIGMIWELAGAVHSLFGRKPAVAAVSASFQACSFHAHMWELFGRLSPSERAIVLAEHLRTHFSGSDRDGQVPIRDDGVCFRLILDPCGSGGARRRCAESSGTDPVPPYCTHCAQNECTSKLRFGFPLWLTEYHVNASQPCVWVIYKDPKLIPAREWALSEVEHA